MNYIFTKELINDYPNNKPFRQLRLYNVFYENEKIAGKFFYYKDEQYFEFEDTKIYIEVDSKLFKKTKYNLLDSNKQIRIGNYEIFGGFGINRFWRDVPSTPTAIVTIDNKTYKFRRIPAEVEYSFFKKDTWGYFKFILYATKGAENFEYFLKMDIPILSKSNYTKYRPFIGKIESNSDNIMVLLAGIYLMDIEFDFEDTKNDR